MVDGIAAIDINGDGSMTGIETVLGAIVALSIVVGAVVIIVRSFKPVKKLIERLNLFFDDWYGEEPRPGVDPRPGVLSRLHALEDSRQANTAMLTDIQETVQEIQTKVTNELNRNGGSSMKDTATEALRVSREIQQAQEADAIVTAKFRAQYLKDQEVTRREWEAVFSTVKDMIGRTPEEQMNMWTQVADAYVDHSLAEDDNA